MGGLIIAILATTAIISIVYAIYYDEDNVQTIIHEEEWPGNDICSLKCSLQYADIIIISDHHSSYNYIHTVIKNNIDACIVWFNNNDDSEKDLFDHIFIQGGYLHNDKSSLMDNLLYIENIYIHSIIYKSDPAVSGVRYISEDECIELYLNQRGEIILALSGPSKLGFK